MPRLERIECDNCGAVREANQKWLIVYNPGKSKVLCIDSFITYKPAFRANLQYLCGIDCVTAIIRDWLELPEEWQPQSNPVFSSPKETE